MMMNFVARPHVPQRHLLYIYEGWGAIMFTDVQSGFPVCLWLVLEVSGVRALLQRARRHVTARRRSPPHVWFLSRDSEQPHWGAWINQLVICLSVATVFCRFLFFFPFLFIFRKETLVKTAAAVSQSVSLRPWQSQQFYLECCTFTLPPPPPSSSSISFLLWVLLWRGVQFMQLLIYLFACQSLL